MAAAPRLPRAFARHLSAVGLANLADGIVSTGAPLIAIGLTRSPVQIGMLSAAVWLPWLLLGMPAGVLVDRWDRRRTMTLALLARAVLLGGVAGLALTGRLTMVWLVVHALLYGVTEVFTDLAAGARVPALVGRDREMLQRANSRLLMVEQIGNGFVGPPLAGALLAVGAAWVLGVPAGVVLVSVLVLTLGGVRVRGPKGSRAGEDVVQPVSGAPSDPAGSLRTELAVGMRTLLGHPVLRPLLLSGGAFNFASTALGTVLVLWLVGPGSAGGLTPQTWSLALVAAPVGALVGGALAGPVLRRWDEVPVMIVAWAVMPVAALVPLVWPSLAGLLGYLALAVPFGVVANVVSGSLRPRLVEERLLGRVGGASRVVGFGTMPLGALAAGLAGETFGLPAVIVGAAVGMAAATLLVRLTLTQSLVDAHEITA